MAGAPFDPEDLVRRITEAGRNIRFGRGVVGKTGHAMIALLGVWGFVIWKFGPDWRINLELILGGLIATGVFIWWTKRSQAFAERNPAMALMEGTEVLESREHDSRKSQ